MNRKEEIEARLAAIRSEMEDPGADLDALTEEVRSLKEELRTINENAEKRGRLRQAVAAGEGTVTRSFAQPAADEPFGVDTEEYRTAWLKHLQSKDLNDKEQRAYTAANGAISVLVVNDIMSVVHDHAPLMERITMVQTHLLRTLRNEGSSTAAAAYQLHAVMIKLIFVGKRIDTCVNLLKVFVKNLCCELLNCNAQLVSYRLHSFSCSVCISVCEVFLFDQSENVRSTCICEADTFAVL